MQALLSLSRGIDRASDMLGASVKWLVLVVVIISASNAVIRKAFRMSSNAALETQWYLFAAIFMLTAGYTFLKNAHVRIDFVSSRLSKRTNAWIDAIGIVAVLFPFCLLMIKLSWPLFYNAFQSGEMSSNAGGLARWPVYALIPLGFLFLMIQGVSEIIKRVAYLRGVLHDPFGAEPEKSEEDVLAEELARESERRLAGASAGGKP
jgi:TRAP-type mannitol/chloroaromatic compound transport system permease small subunit